MLRPPETLHPPQPARLQSWTDSFHSRGHSNNVSQFLVSISAQHHHPASPAGFKRSVEGTEPQLLVDLLSKPKPHLRSQTPTWTQTNKLKLLNIPTTFVSLTLRNKWFCLRCLNGVTTPFHTFMTGNIPISKPMLILRSSRDYLSIWKLRTSVKQFFLCVCSWQPWQISAPSLTKGVFGCGGCCFVLRWKGVGGPAADVQM